ncbi:MAG: transposase [Rikenellaceae bacterium]
MVSYFLIVTKDVKLRELEYKEYLWKKRNNINDEIRRAEELSQKQYFKLSIKNKLIRWYDYVEKHDTERYFRSVVRTFERKNREIINYCENLASNSFAESFNAKIKAFRARLKGIKDTKFFLFRLAMMLG